MSTVDYYTKNGAGLLAAMITTHWQDRGYFGIRAERYHIRDGLWGVRSNIGKRGWPPRRSVWM